ncbi:MAG: DNA starvation/stationary phase protection protein [Rickettsiales bacterium]|nr:DNA starvation/stationary phase protection protein [Rickettsiales bacterium]|tara:strand:- start:31 stop:531 length:501 start_codon:yes stop_codon:yes gene_type:complete
MVSKTLKIVDEGDISIGMDEDARTKVAKPLSKFLATTYTLYMQSLYYHWNVTGKQFVSLHELFEKHYENLHAAGDELAERVRALGHFCPGTYKEFSELSSIEEQVGVPNAEEMVQNLLTNHQVASREARKVLETAESVGDEVTIDMMVERMTFHDEAAWMLRSIIE